MSVIISAPGKDINEFIRHLTNDLRTRRVEYAIIGFINSQGQPIGMIEEKGRTSWVGFDLSNIIETALKLKATGLLLLHNHPVASKDNAQLLPSNEDINLLKEMLGRIESAGLEYCGFWITSNGHVAEILYQIQYSKILTSQEKISEIDINRFLSVDLKNIVISLTKTSLLQIYWYKIKEIYITRHKYLAHILKIRYWGSEDEVYSFKMSLEDENDTEYSGSMTIEEATKAYDAVKELLNIAKHLQGKYIEYTEVKVTLSDQINCGFYQKDYEQSAFLYIGSHPLFLKVESLDVIIETIEKGFEIIERVVNKNDET